MKIINELNEIIKGAMMSFLTVTKVTHRIANE